MIMNIGQLEYNKIRLALKKQEKYFFFGGV